jgi:hypothetical protein
MMAALLSPLALMHPDGKADNIVFMGSACPARLQPLSFTTSLRADLVILAPSDAECKEAGWLENAVRTASEQLSADGILYALVPAAHRAGLMRLLRTHNLQLDTPRLHLPDAGSSRYIVPLAYAPARYAFTSIILTDARKRALILQALRTPAVQPMLVRMLPNVAIVGWRGRPLFQWLACNEQRPAPNHVIVSTSWRKHEVSVVLHTFADQAMPDRIAKVVGTRDSVERRPDEAGVLLQLGPLAQQAGATLPAVLKTEHTGSRDMLVESALAGQTAATLLNEHPARMPSVLNRVARWLEAWSRLTCKTPASTDAFLNDVLFSPLKAVKSHLPEGETYAAWLRRRCASAGISPCVAAHNDLTMWNILIDPNNTRIGVVDWQEAGERALPLTDFAYAAVDAWVIAKRVSRLQAFIECFSPEGAGWQMTRRMIQQLAQAAALPAQWIDLCIHACFLRHAANEQAQSVSEARFLPIAGWLAAQRDALQGAWRA